MVVHAKSSRRARRGVRERAWAARGFRDPRPQPGGPSPRVNDDPRLRPFPNASWPPRDALLPPPARPRGRRGTFSRQRSARPRDPVELEKAPSRHAVPKYVRETPGRGQARWQCEDRSRACLSLAIAPDPFTMPSWCFHLECLRLQTDKVISHETIDRIQAFSLPHPALALWLLAARSRRISTSTRSRKPSSATSSGRKGATYGDPQQGWKMDLISGPYWYEGPDYSKTP